MTYDPGTPSGLLESLAGAALAHTSPRTVSRDTRHVWLLVYISVLWEMHIGKDIEKKGEGGFPDRNAFRHQYLNIIQIKRLFNEVFD